MLKFTFMVLFYFIKNNLRRREITDDLVERLLQIVHTMGTKAEKTVYRELLADLKRVTGKTNLLFMIAEAALANPDGQVQAVIYPIANEKTLQALVKEYRSSGPAYRIKIERTMRRSYSRHYRRMMPVLLNVLEFRTNNKINQPILDALNLLRTYPESKPVYYPLDVTVPIEGIVPMHLHELIIKTNKKGEERVNRINYEMCVWRVLRERLRNKSIWVVGANRYRNPDEDLPADFEEKRVQYYEELNQPLDGDTFITNLQQTMRASLAMLDKNV
ncbi:MAG: Tn3 family transposase, partial [Gammaproteobacteria bacterium]|nr:Tn3 family transposase [Gammaproteobacteria bacterium]